MEKRHIISIFVFLTAALVLCFGQETRPPLLCKIKCPVCPNITCPKGLKVGYNSGLCQCCPSCVIPAGGKCPYIGKPPNGGPEVQCEANTICCDGICTKECECSRVTIERTESSTDGTESSTDGTESSTDETESNTEDEITTDSD